MTRKFDIVKSDYAFYIKMLMHGNSVRGILLNVMNFSF